MNKYLTKAKEQISKAKQSFSTKQGRRPSFLRFSTQDKILFTKRLGMILKAGMPILEGLGMLTDEASSRSSRFIYGHLVRTVSQGQPLSTGLQAFESQFGSFGINIIRVGEASGTLHENLEYLAEEMKRRQALRRKVVGALIYPALIVVATIGIAVMLTVYIFPKILPIFKSVNATLPLTTRILIAVSAFIGSYGWWVLGGLALLAIAFGALLRWRPFHLAVDTILLKIPLLGKLSQYYNLANISRTLSLLLKSGAPIVPSLELVAGSTKNLAYYNALMETRDAVYNGQKVSLTFKDNPKLFPPILSQMTVVGESTGNLTTTLDFLSGMYEEEINELTKHLTTLLEPILMIGMGLVVGFIAISIITPIYSITQSLTPK